MKQTARTWISLVVGGVVSTLSPWQVLCAQPSPAAQPPATPVPATTGPADASSVAALTAALRDPKTNPTESDEAARRLANRGTPDAQAALITVLQNPANTRGRIAAARAIFESPLEPTPEFIVPLGAMLTQDPTLADAAAQALARFRGDPAVRARLIEVAADPQIATQTRDRVIRALGAVPDKRVAGTLVGLVSNRNERPEIQNAAVDALAELTDRRANGRDAFAWQNWWAANQNKSDAEFAADLNAARTEELEQLKVRNDRLAAEALTALRELYKAGDDARREEMLQRFLRAQSPELRSLGVELARTDFTERGGLPASARERLRQMVGDSAAPVRRTVAQVLFDLNEPTAVDPLLAQFQRETDRDARIAQAKALARSNDIRAAGPLLEMVQGRDPASVRAAAQALAELGPTIKLKDPRLSEEISQRLNALFRGIAAEDPDRLREPLLLAMIPFGNPDLRNTFIDLLRPSEPVTMRINALRALGNIRTGFAGDTIVQSGALTDENPDVRLGAVQALGNAATPEHAERLYERLRPDERPDVQQAAWNVLVTLFQDPAFDKETLAQWADRFKDTDNERRLTILQELQAKLQKEANVNLPELAAVKQNIGETHMNLGQYDKAAVALSAAYDDYQQVPGGPSPLFEEGLVYQLVEAYLRSRSYDRAITFAVKTTAKNRGYGDRIGVLIVEEATRLKQGGNLDEAVKLLQEVDRLQPQLPETRLAEVRKLHDQLRSDIAARNKNSSKTMDPPWAHGLDADTPARPHASPQPPPPAAVPIPPESQPFALAPLPRL